MVQSMTICLQPQHNKAWKMLNVIVRFKIYNYLTITNMKFEGLEVSRKVAFVSSTWTSRSFFMVSVEYSYYFKNAVLSI